MRYAGVMALEFYPQQPMDRNELYDGLTIEVDVALDKNLDSSERTRLLVQWAEIMQKIKNPPPPPPDPAVEKAKVEMQVKQQELQMNQQAKAQEMQMKQQEHQMDLQFKAAEHQQSMQMVQEKFAAQMAQNEAKARMQMVADARRDAEGASDAD